MSASISMNAIGPFTMLGEGPHWQQKYQALVYVDINSSKLHRYFPKTDRQQELSIEGGSTGKSVSFVLPIKDRPDLLLIGLGQEIAAVKWPADAPDSSTTKAVSFTTVDAGKRTKFNDAKCDPLGRVWAGTMGFESKPGFPEMYQGSVYRFSPDLQATACIEKVGAGCPSGQACFHCVRTLTKQGKIKVSISNGLCWSNDCHTFYYIDTCTYRIDAFDYDDATAEISSRRTVIDYKKEGIPDDLPDGMAIDATGNLWVANFASHKIICIDPVGKKIVRQIDTPVKNITSVCFGGEDFSVMYATSATYGLSSEELAAVPDSGKLIEIEGLGVKGLPPVEATVSPTVIAKIES